MWYDASVHRRAPTSFLGAFALGLLCIGCPDGARFSPEAAGRYTCEWPDAAPAPDAGPPTYCPACPVCGRPDSGEAPAPVGPGVPCVLFGPLQLDGTRMPMCLYSSGYDPRAVDALCEDCLPNGGACICFGDDYVPGTELGMTPPPCPNTANWCSGA